MTTYLPREIAPRLAQTLRRLPVVVLSGLRQTGKSTLLQHEKSITAGRTYRTVDDFTTLAAAGVVMLAAPVLAAILLRESPLRRIRTRPLPLSPFPPLHLPYPSRDFHDMGGVLPCGIRVVVAAMFDHDVFLDFIEQVEDIADGRLLGGVAGLAVTLPKCRF